MVVEIDKEVLRNSDIDAVRRLTSLITYKQRYQIFVDIDSLEEIDTFDRLDTRDKEIIEAAFNKSINEGLIPDIQVSVDSANSSYSVDESIRYLEQPFRIILENSRNDQPFIQALLDNFKIESSELVRLKDIGAFEFANAGGAGNYINFIDELKGRFTGDHFPKQDHRYLRCFVIVDSDKAYPTEELKKDKIDLITYLKANNIPFHILEKREMENYLPDEAFGDITDNEEYIRAFLHLSPIQKDYFDVEKGFNRKKFDKLSDPIQAHLDSLSDDDKELFRKNDLKKINGSDRNNFKADFPKLFNSNKVTRETLLKRCAHHSEDVDKHPYNPNELPDLLTDITKYL